MAKKKQQPEALEAKVSVREKLKELGGLFLVLCAMFVLISLVSYDPGDVAEIRYPVNSPLENKGGAVGAAVAYALLANLGLAAYVLVFFTGFWAFVVFFRRKLEGLYVKLAAVAVSVMGAATILSMQPILAASALGLESTAPGLGGVYGKASELFLVDRLGAVGAWLALVLSVSVSLVLSTDWMIYVGVLRAASAVRAWAGRAADHFSPEERARRRARLQEERDSVARAELARQVAAVSPVRQALPAPVAPVVVEDEAPNAAPAVAAAPAPRAIESTPIDDAPAKPVAPRADHKPVGEYDQPPIDLFDPDPEQVHRVSESEIRDRMAVLESTLAEYGIDGRVVNYEFGPTVTTYEIQLAPGQQIHGVTARQEEITMRLSTQGVRIVAPLPGKGTVGIEVPNPVPNTVRIRPFLDEGYGDLRKMPLPMMLGRTNGGKAILKTLADLPHLLIAGTTGSGKSVCLKSIVASLVVSMSPEEMKLILIDPKQVELTSFADIPHLWAPVVVEPKKAGQVLDWLVKEMDDRYTMLQKVKTTSIDKFNALGEKKIMERLDEAGLAEEEKELFPLHMPYIVTIIDELADLMMTGRKEVEHAIVRLAQKARAIGIHLVVATQRPSVDVITGMIKSNMPSRISFRVPSQTESRIIMDRKGAERLLGKGDMLVKMIDSFEPVRGQCVYVSDDELRGLVKHLRSLGEPEYHQELLEIKTVGDAEGTSGDEHFDEAVRIILTEGRGSTSLLQRALSVGYSRAARMIDAMTKAGIVGPPNGSNAREILISLEDWEARRKSPVSV